MRRLAVVSACLGCLGCLFFSANAHAFDYDEHKYISNVGFRIALAGSVSSCVPPSDLEQLISRDAIEQGYSFGDIVGMADYTHGVDAILGRHGESYANQYYKDFDQKRMAALKNDWLRFLQAAHGNESHFQLGALMTHLNHHDEAILTAADGRAFRAMVLEAYGLHFLEDFHAPGHAATMRGILPDYVAIAVHEKVNDAGMDFMIHDDRDGELARLSTVAAGLDLRPLKYKDVPEGLLLNADDFKELKTALKGSSSQRFRGDSLLERNKIQAAYLAILAARSVLDVLDAACNDGATLRPHNKNSFVPVCWYFGYYPSGVECAHEPIPDEGGTLKRATTPFGEYKAPENFLRFIFKPGDVLLFSYYNEFSLARGIEGRAGRAEIAAESLLMSLLPSKFVDVGPKAPKRMRDLQRFGWLAPSLLYGVSHTTGDNNSNGFHVRMLLAVPRIDVQASVSYGVRSYDIGGGRTFTAYPIGYGLEAGFGFLLLHLGVNEELSRVPITGEFKTRRLVRGGVTVVLAKSVYRVPFQKLGRLLKRSPDKARSNGNVPPGGGPAS
jgi:hypothetical protein